MEPLCHPSEWEPGLLTRLTDSDSFLLSQVTQSLSKGRWIQSINPPPDLLHDLSSQTWSPETARGFVRYVVLLSPIYLEALTSSGGLSLSSLLGLPNK